MPPPYVNELTAQNGGGVEVRANLNATAAPHLSTITSPIPGLMLRVFNHEETLDMELLLCICGSTLPRLLMVWVNRL